MALAARISNASAIAMLDTLVDRLDIGGAGYVEIRSGSPPATLEDAATGTLLATPTLSATAFGAAVDANPGAMATANTISDDASADNSGTAGYFRAYNGAATPITQGTVGTSGTDMIVNTTTVSAGFPFGITSWVIKMPEQAGEAPGNG